MKVDYDKNEVSLFVDPELSQNEPKADAVVVGEEGALKAGLKAISLRNRSGFKGNIGNFRFAKNWEGVIGEQYHINSCIRKGDKAEVQLYPPFLMLCLNIVILYDGDSCLFGIAIFQFCLLSKITFV